MRIIQVLAVGGLIVVVLLCAASGEISQSTAQPTPTSAPAASVVREVGELVQPLVDASAGAVRADTLAAHPTPQPSPLETLIWPATILLGICLGGGFPSCAIIVYVLARDKQHAREAVVEISKGENNNVKKRPTGPDGSLRAKETTDRSTN
jgi:hypothetical protein